MKKESIIDPLVEHAAQSDLISLSSPVTVILIVIGILAGIIFLDRLIRLHRCHISTQDFLDGIYNVLRRGNTVEAITLCEDTPGPIPAVIRAAVLKSEDQPEDIERSIRTIGLIEIPRLEKGLTMLATAAKIAPMLGLLGTVLGMLESMIVISDGAPLIHVGDLSEGLWKALSTSALGLSIGIPAYAAYNFLVSRVENIIVDMEQAGLETLTFLIKLKRDNANQGNR